MDREFLDAIEANPIIAAVKDEQGLSNCLQREELTVIFILYGDIRSIGEIVERIHQAGKIAMVHIDLITGLSSKEVSVDYICEDIHADGIISTKASMINRAKKKARDVYRPALFFSLIPWRSRILKILETSMSSCRTWLKFCQG